MTIETLFLLVVPTFLVLVAYGQVGARRRGLTVRARVIAVALRVVLLPAALAVALWSTGDPYFLARWGGVVLAMLIAGAVVALLVELIAPRVGA